MKVDAFLEQKNDWMGPGDGEGIVVSSRVRLARNLAGKPFPGWAGKEVAVGIWDELEPLWADCSALGDSLSVQMHNLSPLDRQILLERHLVSREQTERGPGSGLVCRPDESIAVMVNEEDHLRLQALRPGLRLKEAWKTLNEVDTQLEKSVHYAFSPQWGYLTACPTNVGTGMRASVMLHVPGLVLMDEINPIMKGMSKIGLTVRGLWGEGTDAVGHMFQISNQITLGEREETIIANLEQIVQELIQHERNARMRLQENRELLVRDHAGRALGVLSNAHLLTSKEALDFLSGLRLGIDLGILNHIDWEPLRELFVLSQPGHLQKIYKKELNPNERDETRATLVRERIEQACSSGPGRRKA